jgi:selenocysteine lyase/cysteine desulfurase
VREAFGEHFDLPPGYLNTASIGVPSASTADTMIDTVAEWRRGAAQPGDFDSDVLAARVAWARLVGVAPENVATGATVSQLIGLVAASVPDGSRVVCVGREFTSVTFPFAAQAHRGVSVVEADPAGVLGELDGADLLVVSVVQSADGAVIDLAALRSAAQSAGIQILLDVTQAAGWLPMELGWADYVVGACYKWLLAPRGAAWMSVRPDRLAELVPHAANWYAAEDPWQGIYGLPLRLAATARRLDVSPVWFAQRGAATALSWIAELDMVAVRDHCVRLANKVTAELALPPTDSAIIALDVSERQSQRLADAGVVASTRAGRTRLSFHLYNTEEDVRLVVDAVKA